MRVFAASVLAASLVAAAIPAKTEELAIANYGVVTAGMPYAVAMAKGYFKEEGADVTGFISSQGGGTSLRNILNSGVAYGEVNPGAVVAAVQQGIDIKIIADTASTVAQVVYGVKPDSRIKTIKDLKGAKIGYTNPKSTTEALALLLLQAAGLKKDDAQLIKTGGFGEGVAALELGQIDVFALPEPLWQVHKAKFRLLATAADVFPALNDVVAVTTGPQLEKRADFIKAIIRARRRAVEFMASNPDEAGDIIAKPWNITPEVARAVVRFLSASRTQGIPYWSSGQFHMESLNRMIEAQKMVGAVVGDVDMMKIIDTRFLPDDIKALK